MSTMKSTKQTMGQYEQEETVSVGSERNLGASCHRAFPHPGAHSRSIFQEHLPCLSWLAPFLHSAHFTALSG